MRINGQEIGFMRPDGTMCGNAIYCQQAKDGEILFFELLDMASPKLNGKNMYKRIMVRRVFPVVGET